VDVPSIDDLDRMPDDEFEIAVAPLFEGAPRFLARLADARPFGSVRRMFDRAIEVAMAMPEEEQIELVDAHPRLGAPPESVSELSFSEQGYDREDAGAARAAAAAERDRVAAALERLNDAYEARFGFRYCVFVAGRPRAALIPEMQAALERRREEELVRALGDVVAIAEARFGAVRTEAASR
jgi:2-oxo-4-hydroxy-4-carboxy--5-ureidoimidazoline (OHCU) decarboxylase